MNEEYNQDNYGQNPQSQEPYEYDDPYQNRPPEEPAGFAIASLVLGIISLLISCMGINIITGILAVVFGIIHMVKYSTRRGMAIAGIVLGVISVVIFVGLVILGVAMFTSNPDIMQDYSQFLNQMDQL